MMWFVSRRLVYLVPTLIGVSIIIFVLLRVIPGDVAAIMLGDYANPKDAAELTAKLGLDKPIIVQYGEWIVAVLQGKAGVSLYHGNSVAGELWKAIPVKNSKRVKGPMAGSLLNSSWNGHKPSTNAANSPWEMGSELRRMRSRKV